MSLETCFENFLILSQSSCCFCSAIVFLQREGVSISSGVAASALWERESDALWANRNQQKTTKNTTAGGARRGSTPRVASFRQNLFFESRRQVGGNPV